jgi:hypothetical protein
MLCAHSDICDFFRRSLPSMPDDSDSLIEKYCNGNSLNCARSMVFDSFGPDKVPAGLMPGDKTDAYGILAGG